MSQSIDEWLGHCFMVILGWPHPHIIMKLEVLMLYVVTDIINPDYPAELKE